MKRRIPVLLAALFTVTVSMMVATARPAMAESAQGLEEDARAALASLYSNQSGAKALGDKAVGILVFPSIVKAGFIVGAQYGEGVLFKGGEVTGYYHSVAASYGLQAGIQKYGYALFLMTDAAVKYLDKSDGWELGSGPSIVVVDEGFARSMSTTTLQSDVYAYIFDQKGLMAGLGIQGSKITRVNK